MKMRILIEDNFLMISAMRNNGPTVILCDRGIMDTKAFVDDEIWNTILDETGWSTQQLRDRRYDAVLHLMSAASGAVDFYND
jgi:hypothetical protein